MNSFQLYFKLGVQHILDLQGFDHILFIIALCAVFLPRDWKKIIWLVTSFTIGHTITLALATFKLINVNAGLIEFLIPVTIAITAISSIFKPRPTTTRGFQFAYVYALFFGLIHGLGFSNYLRELLGTEASIWQPLLAFNLGLELGQVVIVAIYLVATSIVVGMAGVNRKDWALILSSFVLGISFMLMLETKFW